MIERERVTHVAAAVSLIVNWLRAKVADKCDVSSLRVIINRGARLAPELRRRVL